MKERTYGIILGILNAVLLAVCGVFFLGKDRNAPEIFLPEGSVVYAEESGTEVLFEGVTAFDKEDGELTGSVVIEKIVTNEGKETATITYGVADRAGNVGKATCTVAMSVEPGSVEGTDVEEGTSEAEEEEEESTGTDVAEEDGEGAEEEPDTDAAEEAEEESSETEDEDADVEENDEESEEETSEAEAAEEKKEPLPTAGEAGNNGQTVASKPDAGRPTMTFKTREVKVKAGSTPVWVDVIEGLHDDKDDYGTLLKTLKINGEYNKDKAGTYPITLTIKDSDGHESNAYPVKIIVEAWN